MEQAGKALTVTVSSQKIPNPSQELMVALIMYWPPLPELTFTDEPVVEPMNEAPEVLEVKDQLYVGVQALVVTE